MKKVKIKTKIQKDIKLNGNKQDIEHIVSTLLDDSIFKVFILIKD